VRILINIPVPQNEANLTTCLKKKRLASKTGKCATKMDNLYKRRVMFVHTQQKRLEDNSTQIRMTASFDTVVFNYWIVFNRTNY
jgi:hypothetical protein